MAGFEGGAEVGVEGEAVGGGEGFDACGVGEDQGEGGQGGHDPDGGDEGGGAVADVHGGSARRTRESRA